MDDGNEAATRLRGTERFSCARFLVKSAKTLRAYYQFHPYVLSLRACSATSASRLAHVLVGDNYGHFSHCSLFTDHSPDW